MPVRYLLDTNTASYVIKGNFPRVRERLMKTQMAEVGISVITEAELRFGVARKPAAVKLRTAIEEFLLRVETLPWDSEAAQQYGQIRAALERVGQPMGNLDMMIAAHSLALAAVLVTNNTRHYERIPAPLMLQDWSEPAP